MVRIDEFRALSTEDLAKQVEESKQELLNLRFRLATKQLVNHRELPMVKKRIARIKTILKERELGNR
ncbi:MAG TPA: 50S ribosomal protein L29 [Dehalococcoidales bacterium]|jgi:large subunit ribosomal protein L29|nr:50S ribosomal protein L29 [Dehalococcoidales bacterium]HET6477640.1 50S ribosomal protein L29 [Dehalococcoidales bacterium]